MSDVITSIFSSFTDTISGLGQGIKNAFLQIFYVDPTASDLVVSDVAKFGFLMLGFAMATGLVMGAVRMLRR